MNDRKVSIRLFNSTADSYFPTDAATVESLSNFLSMDSSKLKEKLAGFSTPNPLLGIRGVRCALLYQSFLAMQIRAIFGARHALEKTSKTVTLQILIPMLTSEHEAERSEWTRSQIESQVG
jgi:phosphoenolpyruvate-protein kinase (PTS system EI component)